MERANLMKFKNLALSLLALMVLIAVSLAQETTGGLQGTVKDPSGAVVPHARMVLTSPSLIGSKESTSDTNGYYRFANLPPGTYTMEASAKGFQTATRDGRNIEVGHLTKVDIPY